MPQILAIDTSTDACSVALIQNDHTVTEKLHQVPREHTQKLLPMIESLLSETTTSLKDLDAIVFTAGPGSFTGLRIALSTAQGLAYGADLPLVSVSTLETMAQRFLREIKPAEGSVILPVIDARMDEVYWAAYHVENGKLVQVLKEQVGSPQECVENAQTLSMSEFNGIGSGLHYAAFELLTFTSSDQSFYPSAWDVAVIGATKFEQGETVSPQDAEPVYLRNEISWQKRQRIRNQ